MIVAGFGFRQGAAMASLQTAFALAQDGHEPVTLLATVADKLEGLRPLAKALGLPVIGVTNAALRVTETPTRSAASLAAYDTGSVAEASALAAAGPGGRLLAPRHISPDRMATCAIVQGLAK